MYVCVYVCMYVYIYIYIYIYIQTDEEKRAKSSLTRVLCSMHSKQTHVCAHIENMHERDSDKRREGD
jgi:hypothetical protein